MPEDFNLVQLTDQEREYAIFDARCKKYYDQKREQEKQSEWQAIKDAAIPWSASELREFVLKNNPDFKVDHQSEKVFNLLCQYFSNDSEFEKSGYSLKKGIMLTGPVGVGKTRMLQVFRRNKKQCFQLISVYEIETACQEHGIEFHKTYTGMVPGWGGTLKCFYQKSIGWAFDDVGRESVVFDFGNKSDIISRLIQVRYLQSNSVPFSSLHLTTNLTPAEIENRYDYAVKSRLREMFNYIPMEGKDRR